MRLGHLRDLGVRLHRLDPHAQPGDVAARLLSGLVREVLGGQVGEEELDVLVIDAVLFRVRVRLRLRLRVRLTSRLSLTRANPNPNPNPNPNLVEAEERAEEVRPVHRGHGELPRVLDHEALLDRLRLNLVGLGLGLGLGLVRVRVRVRVRPNPKPKPMPKPKPSHHVELAAHEHEHAVEEALDQVGRLLEVLEQPDVLGLARVRVRVSR